MGKISPVSAKYIIYVDINAEGTVDKPDVIGAVFGQTEGLLGTELELTIESPFSESPKSEIIRKGFELGVPFDLTWSCYINGFKHCGRCESCVNRKRAFLEAATQDPTEYMG